MTQRRTGEAIRRIWRWLSSPDDANDKLQNVLRRLAAVLAVVVPVATAVLFFARTESGEASVDTQVELLTVINTEDGSSSEIAAAANFLATNYNWSQLLGSDEVGEPTTTWDELPETVVFSDFRGVFLRSEGGIVQLAFTDPPIGACDVTLIGVLGNYYGPVACRIDTGLIAGLEGGTGLPIYIRALFAETAPDDEDRIPIIERLEFRRYKLAFVRVTNQGPNDAHGIEIDHSPDYSPGTGLSKAQDEALALLTDEPLCGGPLDAAHSCIAYYRSDLAGRSRQELTPPELVTRVVSGPEYDYKRIAVVLAILVSVYFIAATFVSRPGGT